LVGPQGGARCHNQVAIADLAAINVDHARTGDAASATDQCHVTPLDVLRCIGVVAMRRKLITAPYRGAVGGLVFVKATGADAPPKSTRWRASSRTWADLSIPLLGMQAT
jgi:hypothetical protein